MGSKPVILAALYPGCIFFEIALALELLSSRFEITFVTPDGQDHYSSNGSCLRAHASYERASLENCRAILIPGGNPDSIAENRSIDAFVQAAHQRRLWLAAICAGTSILAKAGDLGGRKIAHGYGPEQLDFLRPYFEGATLTNEPLIVDGHIMTAKPDAHIDFAVELTARLGVVDLARAARLKDYYRGVLGRKIRPLALALIQNSKGQYLFHQGHDKLKGEIFYRPLGGGIEFAESGQSAVAREIKEELDLEVTVSELRASFENIFVFEGSPGHEIVLLFPVTFKHPAASQRATFDIVEDGVVVGKAVWRSVAEIVAEGAQLYPNGLKKVLNG